MTNYVQRITLSACLLAGACGATPVNANPNQFIKHPSESQLLADFQQQVLLSTAGIITESEVMTDFAVIGEFLAPLLSFAHNNPRLQNTLLACVTTLLTTNKTNSSTGNIQTINKEAILLCQEEFSFFCSTIDQYEMVNRSLGKIRLYFEPLNTAFSLGYSANDESDKKIKLVGACVISAAVAALIYVVAK